MAMLSRVLLEKGILRLFSYYLKKEQISAMFLRLLFEEDI
jgi:hypothetical protein